MAETRTIAVCGATGRQGGAVARALLDQGWNVRALTRRPERRKARNLAELGADVVRADMSDRASLDRVFDGVRGVYSVQNGIASGFDEEVVQGTNVAEAAHRAGVAHIVYGSAGIGAPTGIPSWDSKLPIEERLRALDVPYTIFRPKAFMELMTDKSFFPAVGTWRLMPRLAGDDVPIPWLAVDDLGRIAAAAFTDPERFAGTEMSLAGDVRTLAECAEAYREAFGRSPRTFPMPVSLFDRFTRKDPSTMWRWLRTGTVELDTSSTKAILPSASSVPEWLATIRQPTRPAA